MSFPRYERYKGSGVEWLEDVPTHWIVTPLKRVVDHSRPITYGIVQAGPNVAEGTPYIRPADMREEGGVENENDLLKTSVEIAASYKRSELRCGDIVCSIGPSFGKLMIVPPSLEGANLTQGTARIAIGHGQLPRFFFWVLRSRPSFCQWESSVGGATFRALNLEPLAETVVCKPSIGEQSAIAAFLDRETAKIDALVDEQKRLIGLLKEKQQAVIFQSVTKGLDQNAPMKDSGIEWLGEVPSYWKIKQLRHLAHPGTSITYGIVQAGPDIEGGVPYIRTSDMSGDCLPCDGLLRTSPEIDASYSRSKVNTGDLVIAIRATIGKPLIVPECLNGANLTQGTAKFSPDKDVSAKYVCLFLRSVGAVSEFERIGKGATFKEITLEMLRKFPVLKPPLNEQQAIVVCMEHAIAKFSALVAEAEAAIVLLQERRSALISAAVTGKIDVRGLTSAKAEAA